MTSQSAVTYGFTSTMTAHVIEGWTTEADHHRVFAGEAAQAIVARFAGLLAKEPEYTDLTPVGGKALLP